MQGSLVEPDGIGDGAVQLRPDRAIGAAAALREFLVLEGVERPGEDSDGGCAGRGTLKRRTATGLMRV